MLRVGGLLLFALVLAACVQKPVQDNAIRSHQGFMPVNLSGSWEQDYSRGDDVNKALGRLFRRLSSGTQGQRMPNYGVTSSVGGIASSGDISAIIALARLAELITRPTVMTIAQNDSEISIEREGDFSMVCEFYDTFTQGVKTDFGTEVCGWDGQQFVSRLMLPDGLVVSHRFTIAPDRQDMHVATTVSSGSTRIPFTLNRFYTRFEPAASEYNCIETLSRKRVCSTSGVPK